MKATINNHLLSIDGKQVTFKKSPNVSGLFTPSYLIMHYTAATEASGSISWFLAKESQVSAHLVIDREGNVTQFAPFNVVCWHAGQSKWKNIIGMNSHSIGIEFVNGGLLAKKGSDYVCPTDGKKVSDFEIVKGQAWQKYTNKQIEVGKAVADAITSTYKILDILGHNDISPIRKIDPGAVFPWSVFKSVHVTKETTANVNLRKEPVIGNNIIETLNAATIVNFFSEENGWSKVSTNKNEGYIKSDYLK